MGKSFCKCTSCEKDIYKNFKFEIVYLDLNDVSSAKNNSNKNTLLDANYNTCKNFYLIKIYSS